MVRAVPFDPTVSNCPALQRWFTDLGVVRYPVREPDEASTTRLEWYLRSSSPGATSRTVHGDPEDLPVSHVSLLLINVGVRSEAPEATALKGSDDSLG